MVLFHRGHALARLPIAHTLASWPQPRSLVLVRLLCSATCSQATSMRCLTPIHDTRLSQPQLLLSRRARHAPVSWSHLSWIHIGRFSSFPSSGQAKRSKPSQRPRSNTRVPQGLPQPAKETLAPRTHTIPNHSKPIEVCQPTNKTSSKSKQRMPPRAKSTRSAVRYIIGINVIVYMVWRHCLWQQICMHEKCKDEQCGHEICGEVQWMMMNTLNSKLNITARRYWTLVTASFTHFVPQYLFTNMLVLAIFARAFYTAGGVGIGAFHVMGLTLGSAVFGNLAGLIYRWNSPLDLRYAKEGDIRAHWSAAGASGVTNTFATAATCLAPRTRIAFGRFRTPVRIYWVTMFVIFNDLMALGNDDGVGHEVHLAGAAFGLAYYLLVLRRPYGWW